MQHWYLQGFHTRRRAELHHNAKSRCVKSDIADNPVTITDPCLQQTFSFHRLSLQISRLYYRYSGAGRFMRIGTSDGMMIPSGVPAAESMLGNLNERCCT